MKMKLVKQRRGFHKVDCPCGHRVDGCGDKFVYVCNDCHTATNDPADHDCEVAYRERMEMLR